MLSLREQQERFAAAILGGDTVPPIGLSSGDDAARVSIYRNNVYSNYRNALRASYPVVCRLVGRAFFDTAVDAFVRARPSTSGDLNAYGGDFGDWQSKTMASVIWWGDTNQAPSLAARYIAFSTPTCATTSGAAKPISSAAVTKTRFQA